MKIKILLAAPRGYCAWVTRAIEIVDQALKDYWIPLYVNHEIIHNRFIINYFENKGVIFGEKVTNIPEWNIIIFSAHGIGPEFIKKVKKQKLQYIDASCPLVVKVHNEAKKYLSEWFEILYIWKKWHQEAEWIIEEGREKIHIISSKEDLDIFYNDNRTVWKLALLTQTTLWVDETQMLIEDIKMFYSEIVLPKAEDICYATTNRQQAVTEIVSKSDILLVVWSKNSSNSSKLQHIGEKNNIPSFLIDNYKEIDLEQINTIVSKKWKITIWISGWASAPEKLIQEVVSFLQTQWEVTLEEVQAVKEKMVFPSKIVLQS